LSLCLDSINQAGIVVTADPVVAVKMVPIDQYTHPANEMNATRRGDHTQICKNDSEILSILYESDNR